MSTPNIFDYATSELSQDAFICYMLNFPEPAKLFLEKCGIRSEEIKSIKTQYPANICDDKGKKYKGHIDILVETDKHYLIIEDKTGTDEHDDQIHRYCDAITKDSNLDKNKSVCVCYVKTDYLSEQDIDNLISKENKEKLIEIITHIYAIYDIKYLFKLMQSKNGKDYITSLFNLLINHYLTNTNFNEELNQEDNLYIQNQLLDKVSNIEEITEIIQLSKGITNYLKFIYQNYEYICGILGINIPGHLSTSFFLKASKSLYLRLKGSGTRVPFNV